mmetsp:Transcript_9702/g.23887  ORF Transcript_9702/g.23887 Transcript_9702/m.23887 type:complete len:205 (-) Transcript_9702:1354-1968(-)
MLSKHNQFHQFIGEIAVYMHRTLLVLEWLVWCHKVMTARHIAHLLCMLNFFMSVIVMRAPVKIHRRSIDFASRQMRRKVQPKLPDHPPPGHWLQLVQIAWDPCPFDGLLGSDALLFWFRSFLRTFAQSPLARGEIGGPHRMSCLAGSTRGRARSATPRPHRQKVGLGFRARRQLPPLRAQLRPAPHASPQRPPPLLPLALAAIL